MYCPIRSLSVETEWLGSTPSGCAGPGSAPEKILAVREAYHILYRSKLLQKLAVEKLDRELGHVDIIADMLVFIRGSKRGFISSYHFDNQIAAKVA